jgi:hypothetical protein
VKIHFYSTVQDKFNTQKSRAVNLDLVLKNFEFENFKLCHCDLPIMVRSSVLDDQMEGCIEGLMGV